MERFVKSLDERLADKRKPSRAIRERWKPVVGYEKFYEVSSFGRVRQSGNHNVYKLSLMPNGYPRMILYDRKGGRRTALVHTLVLEAFRGPRPKDYVAAHLDGSTYNNHLSNLAWVTQAENASHKNTHGTSITGERHWGHKLTSKQVLSIRKEYKRYSGSRSNVKVLAAKYGVSHSCINRIANRKTWSALTQINQIFEDKA